MRAVIYEPEPRMCGPMTWAFHLKDGFLRLGHECDILCSTKSGKARVSWGAPQSSGGGRWWSRSPDRILRHDELVEALDGYDVIVMPEIKNPMQDSEAAKSEDERVLPVYVDALRRTRTPWTTALHGSLYPPKLTPYLDALLESPSLGQVMTVSEFSMPSNDRFADLDVRRIAMPYVLRNEVDAPATLRSAVGMLGRFAPNKGCHVAIFAAMSHLDSSITYEQWGSASKGAGCSPTYDLWNFLRTQYPDGRAVRYYKEYEVEPGNKTNPYHWDFRASSDKPLVRYLGNYSDPVATAARLGVHAALTSDQFAGGLVEYSTLEATDAGCLCITPRHFSDPQFDMWIPAQYGTPAGVKVTWKKHMDTIVAEIGELMQSCSTLIRERPHKAHEVVRHNRSVIATRNDPARVAQDAIDAAHASDPFRH